MYWCYFRVGDYPGVERLRSTLRRLSRVAADDRFLYSDPARCKALPRVGRFPSMCRWLRRTLVRSNL